MKKFKVTVTRVDEYEVHIDEEIWTPGLLKEWESTFWDLPDGLQSLAESVGHALILSGFNNFHEGFGYLKELDDAGEPEWWTTLKKDSDLSQGIAVKTNYSEDIEKEVDEII
jgi:hypothetical protein